MDAPYFDFAAFIGSPGTNGETAFPWGDIGGAELRPAMQPPASRISSKVLTSDAPHEQMLSSYPAQGIDGIPVRSYQHDGALADNWDPFLAGTASARQQQPTLPMPSTSLAVDTNFNATAAAPQLAVPDGIPLPLDYRASISAHHSQQLRQRMPRLSAAQVSRLPAGYGAAGRGTLRMHSSPSMPLSQASRNVSHSAKPKKPELTIQERRRVLRRSKSGLPPHSSSNITSPHKRSFKRSRTGTHAAQIGEPVSKVVSWAADVGAAAAAPSLDRSSRVFTGDHARMVANRQPGQAHSTSGFDLAGALTRIATRPNPVIKIGPLDLSCSVTVSDASQPDQPIIYCSDTFCQLTGYERQEILGRNCRFLQSPSGHVEQGSAREFTDPRAVRHMREHTRELQECQTSLINYRKSGQPFINLVTIVPVSWGPNVNAGAPALAGAAAAPIFLVGFQVDLVESPDSVIARSKDGTYHVNYSHINARPDDDAMIHRSAEPVAAMAQNPAVLEAQREVMMAEELAKIMGSGSNETSEWANLLLENSHDIVHVLSLKGTFLYVSPSVKRVLGWTPEELVGRSISEFCHPSDVVPVFRELKDSTSNASIAAAARQSAHYDGTVNPITRGGAGQSGPQVSLLMRMRHKSLGHVWIESTGKLHLEQGKGRKVVISSARPRPVHDLQWENARSSISLKQPGFWSKVSLDGLFLSTSGQVSEVLGKDANDSSMSGRHMRRVSNEEAHGAVLASLRSSRVSSVPHTMSACVGGEQVAVLSTFYPSHAAADGATRDQNTVYMHTQRRSPSTCSLKPNVSYPQHTANAIADAAAGLDAHETGVVCKASEPGVGSAFAELSTNRTSSWVFELHQLKNANRRLREEVNQRRRFEQGGITCIPSIVRQSPEPAPLEETLHSSPSNTFDTNTLGFASTLAHRNAVPRGFNNAPQYSSNDEHGSFASLRAPLYRTASNGAATSLSAGSVPNVAGVKRQRT